MIQNYEAAHGRIFEVNEANAQMLLEETSGRYTNHFKRELTELRRDNGEQLLIGAKVTEQPIQETAKKFNRTAVVYTNEKSKHKVIDRMANTKIERVKEKVDDTFGNINDIQNQRGVVNEQVQLDTLYVDTTQNTAVIADVVVEETKIENANRSLGVQEQEKSETSLEALEDELTESLDNFLDNLNELDNLDDLDLEDNDFINSLDDAAALDADSILTDIDEGVPDTVSLTVDESTPFEEEDIPSNFSRGPSNNIS